MAVGEDEVRHVANLARLGLEPGRLSQLAQELNGILAHMDALAAVDVGAVGDAADAADAGDAAPRGMPLRRDGDDASTAARLVSPAAREAMAPAMRDGFFLVPRLATHEGDDSPDAA